MVPSNWLMLTTLSREHTCFGPRFIDTVKALNSGVRYKCRLGAQNYEDRDPTTIVTKALTVHRLAQRLMLYVAAYFDNKTCDTRDITQAYT